MGEDCRIRLLNCALQIQSSCDSGDASIDGIRALLIQTGQLEQSIQDAQLCSTHADSIYYVSSATFWAAEAFVSRYFNIQSAQSGSAERHALQELVHCLDNVKFPAHTEFVLKIPEGFSYYTLFPEQYACATKDWLLINSKSKTQLVTVVGIRSIGTTLSAVVAAVLTRAGWDVHRISVRPTGHPFKRIVQLKLPQQYTAGHSIVVDEGPGISGTSMAATADALTSAGIARSRVNFFPSHSGTPQRQMDETTRMWWTDAPRYVVPLNDIRWNGRSLAECLCDATSKIIGTGNAVDRIEDFGGGRWREFLFKEESDWPAVCAQFERSKYRVVCRDKSSVFWKFVGLSDECSEFDRLKSLAEDQYQIPFMTLHGYIGRPWLEGTPLRVGSTDNDTLDQVAHFIRRAARAPLDNAEHIASIERLIQMLCCNANEIFGDSVLCKIDRLAAIGRTIPQFNLSQSSGAHLAPTKWIHTPDGRIVNVDRVGHDCDHTCIGRQTLLWDVAAVVVDWCLDEASEQLLLNSIPELCNVSCEMTNFMKFSFAAFRAGQCAQCIEADYPKGEKKRLKQATEFYKTVMNQQLK